MVKVIMGLKGSGKTKQLIELVAKAVEEEHGNVVCIEKGAKLTFDIPYTVRLVQTADYSFGDIEFFKGFVSGLHAGNFDITHVFIDSLYKIVEYKSDEEIASLLDWMDAFSEKEGVKFTITISADADAASPGIKKYF